MRQFHTVVLDTFRDLSAGYRTEPYEAAWATEATFFIRSATVAASMDPVEFVVEISPDGIAWVVEGTVLTVRPGDELTFVRVTHFGGWLRLRQMDGPGELLRATVYLVLKE